MRKHLLTLFLSLGLLSSASMAQKYACVNTDYVMHSIPDFASAQQRLDKYVADWQKELADKAAEVESLRASYEQESFLLPDNLKKRRLEEINAKEQELRDQQQQYFGAGGELDRRRAELLKPIQDRVYSTIEKVAHEKNYAFVFDKAGSATLLFVNKKYDISDEVLELMGYKPGSKTTTPESPSESKESKQIKRPTNPEMRNTQGGRIDRNNLPPLSGSTNSQNKK